MEVFLLCVYIYIIFDNKIEVFAINICVKLFNSLWNAENQIHLIISEFKIKNRNILLLTVIHGMSR